MQRASRRSSAYASILGILVCALAASGCGSSSSASPTATPKPPAATPTPIVITATSAPATPGTTSVRVVVTATPRPGPTPKPGHVTPLPGATPVPTAPGLTLGMITRPASDVATFQAGADRKDKHYTFYLHPDQVIKQTLPRYGFSTPVDLVGPPRPSVSYSGRPVRKAVVKDRGQLYRVYVAQPGRRGPTGVWVVVTILRQQVQTGPISRPASVVQRLQHLADIHNKVGLLYLNPDKVVTQELSQYGFDPDGTKIVTPASPVKSATGRPQQMAVVKYDGRLYDVYVTQPGVRGPKGVWVVVTIRPV